MSLGIGLHAAIPFVPYWPKSAPDGDVLWLFVSFVHGFRMPLFFLLSGFFTALVWKRRGLNELVRQRLRRVGLPLLVGLFTILPAVWFGGIAGWLIAGAGKETEVELDYIESTSDVAEKLSISGEAGAEEFDLAHLWFLWMLLWLLAAFVVVVWTTDRAPGGRNLRRRIGTVGLVALPLFAVLPALEMTDGFGPDTSGTFIPDWDVLVYYACFFFFGVLSHRSSGSPAGSPGSGSLDPDSPGGDGFDVPIIDRVSRGWPPMLVLATLVLFPLGLGLTKAEHAAGNVVAVVFAWAMSFGLIGAFRHTLAQPRFGVRYLSDSSYWMYLVHLPMVLVAQGFAARVPLPASVNATLITVCVTAVGLVSYRYMVRYTVIGTLLNGPRTRWGDEQLRAEIDGRDLPEPPPPTGPPVTSPGRPPPPLSEV